MPVLSLPAGFAFPSLATKVASDDPLFDGKSDQYLQAGLSALNIIETALLGNPEPKRILDLPCGFGRVSRFLKARYPASELTVCDQNRQAVDFGAVSFGANGVYATLNFRDLELGTRFDLIWAGALLTQLPEHQTRQFLDFAVRHMAPDSRLIVTSYGEAVAARLPSAHHGLSEAAARGLQVQYLNAGYGYRRADDTAAGVALVAPEWFEAHLPGSKLHLRSHRRNAWQADQDVVVMCGTRIARGAEPATSERFFDRPSIALPLPAAEQALQDEACVPGFDENWYLQNFTDIAAAIEDGRATSGFAHFLASGWREGRPPFNPEHRYGRHAEARLDRVTLRELGEAALRNLPFLPGVFDLDENGLTIAGDCGAPSNITAHMAFFVNGRKIEDVTYPFRDSAPDIRFLDVPGMDLSFRARVPWDWDELRSGRFLRFDAAPSGRYSQADWRRAVHYMMPAQERFAFPPAANMKRVIGDTSVERFAMGGAMIFNNVGNYLREMGHAWADFPNILDWGCGAGRITRYLIGETACAITGVDIDSDNIAWCRETYAGGRFMTVPLRPPTELADAAFDLVLGLSVLTHLQEEDQFLWLDELRRITRPGALLFLSVQGPTHFSYNRIPPQVFRKVQEMGFLDLFRDPALDGVVSDTEYYRAAMHSRPYILRRWGEFFDVLDIVDALAVPQDFVVLRRR
jgi:trans-aconitate methyltransferase